MMITVFTDHAFPTLWTNAFPAWDTWLMRDLCIAMQANTKACNIFMMLVVHVDWFI